MPKIESEYRWLGATIRRLRLDQALSQERLAAETDMSRSALANVEAGQQRVAFHLVLALARALHVDPVELLPPAPSEDLSVDEHLRRLGVPTDTARAVAKVVNGVADDHNDEDDDETRARRIPGSRHTWSHETSSSR
ncbi:helix-turn-helix domain-containing protein [Fodinicola acaciae]|uniref:helix-turn-helix domain-containing protein n=1 Tax=Fodinicola acaciae TaxID=2681555 RepID=UPI0013D8695F